MTPNTTTRKERMEIQERNDLVVSWMPEVKKVARRAAIDWPGIVDEEDLEQEVYLHILERPKTVKDLAAMNDDNRYQTLHKIAQRIASQERADYERFSGNFRYSVDEVRSLLESAGDPERSEIGSSWSTGDYTRSGGGHSDPTANTAIRNIQLSDAQRQLAEALASLKESNVGQYDALVERHVHGVVPRAAEGDRESEKRRVAKCKLIERALISVTTKMNHGVQRQHSEGMPMRKAISNSTARYLAKEAYDADYMPAPSHLRDNYIEPEVWE